MDSAGFYGKYWLVQNSPSAVLSSDLNNPTATKTLFILSHPDFVILRLRRKVERLRLITVLRTDGLIFGNCLTRRSSDSAGISMVKLFPRATSRNQAPLASGLGFL